ncbi:hypothetical protein GCM10023195_16480 [Actinoallomurus liliacearum]|uniref:Uncharacterized protein n=1 Tax=Actinoallomurus liliacearum TaxID=1080073 RepID=A0ABP8TG83_9ACTN
MGAGSELVKKQAVAAAVTVAAGMALAFAAYGEGAFNLLFVVGVPGLLVALFVLPLWAAARPGDLRRMGWWAAAVLGGGLLLLTVTAPKFALLVLGDALLLTLGWPLATSAACLMAVAAVRSALSQGPRAARTWARSSWAGLLSVVATYGYGLSHLDDGMTDKDRVCRFAPSGVRTGHNGGQSLLPLSDTTCGPDTVPAFVNPILAVLTVLLALSLAAHVAVRLKAR